MRRRAGLFAAGMAGAVAGALLVLALPVPGSREPSDGRAPDVRPAEIDTLLVWTPSQIPSGLPERIEDLRSVSRLTVVRSGVVWLQPDDRGPGALAFPVEVAAVDTATYRDFVPPADRATIAGLRADGAVVGRSSASLHGLAIGDRVRLSRGGGGLTVEGVLEDTLVGAHEFVVGLKQGARLGIARPRYILVEPLTEADPSRVEASIRRVVPNAVRVRVRTPGETPVFRHGDAVLPQVEIKELFGEFAAAPASDGTLDLAEGWVRRNIRTAPVPVLGEVRCHRLVIPMIRAALEDLESRGLGRLVDPADYGGCFYPRFIASDPGSGISRHSWGIAIDINVSEGLPGRQPTLDKRIVEAFERQGFIWGGRFLIPDGTHFEFQRFP